MEYLANSFCSVVLVDAFYKIIMFGWILCSKFNFIAIFLTNFAAFIDHTKGNLDVSENDS